MHENYLDNYSAAIEQVNEKHLSIRQSNLLSQLEVAVSVELATLSLSAASLIDWAAGERVALQLPDDDAVVLTVGAERIAKAYLRKDGDQLFLEIAELYQETSA